MSIFDTKKAKFCYKLKRRIDDVQFNRPYEDYVFSTNLPNGQKKFFSLPFPIDNPPTAEDVKVMVEHKINKILNT